MFSIINTETLWLTLRCFRMEMMQSLNFDLGENEATSDQEPNVPFSTDLIIAHLCWWSLGTPGGSWDGKCTIKGRACMEHKRASPFWERKKESASYKNTHKWIFYPASWWKWYYPLATLGNFAKFPLMQDKRYPATPIFSHRLKLKDSIQYIFVQNSIYIYTSRRYQYWKLVTKLMLHGIPLYLW